MSDIKDIETRIDESINSLSGITRAMPGSHLYPLILVRIDNAENNFWGKTSKTLGQPVFALLTLCIIVTLNLFVIINNDLLPVNFYAAPEKIRSVDDLGVNSFYQVENIQP